jgi:uncharacterized membrane protein YwaF
MENDTKLLIVLMTAAFLIPVIIIFMAIEFGFYDQRMILVMFMMFTALPMIAAGLYMWATGKGQMAISGYNTMSKAQREHYDGEKMAKDVGKFLVIISMILLGFCLISYSSNGMLVLAVLMGLLFGVIIVFIAYAGTGKRYLKDPTKTPPPPTKQERRVMWAIFGVIGVVTAVVLIIVFVLIGGGNVTATMDDDALRVDGSSLNRSIGFDDIVTVEFRDGFDHGSRTSGFGGTRVLGGNFNNSEFGDYSLACYTDVQYHIVITPTQGKVLVFNLSTAEETEEFCIELIKKVSGPPATE